MTQPAAEGSRAAEPGEAVQGATGVEGVQAAESPEPTPGPRRVDWTRVLAYGVLPGLALLLAMAAGVVKWYCSPGRAADLARAESIEAATEAAVAVLSYRPDTVEQDVAAAHRLLTGAFRDSFTEAARDRLIPDATQRRVTAVAAVPAAASVSVTENHAVVLVFVDETLTVESSAPTEVTSSYRVTLDKVGGRWLVAAFEPV